MRTHVFSLYVAATPGEVWTALTLPELTPSFYFGLRVESTWAEGAAITFHSAESRIATGDIVQLEPGKTLMHSLADAVDEGAAAGPDTPDQRPASWITWDLEQREDGVTRVRLVVDELENDILDPAETEHVWARLLSSLKTLLETGTGLIPRRQSREDAALPDAG